MAKQGTEVEVRFIPSCDFTHDNLTPAVYDGATVMGPWANMCEEHFSTYGKGIGVGFGQRFILSK